MKNNKHRLFILLTLTLIFSITYLNLSSKGSAENILKPIDINIEQVEVRDLKNQDTNEGEGKVVFSLKTDFVSLTNFLGITEEEYFKLKKNYSMLEIAEKQNISKDELFNYLVSKHFEALDAHYKEGKIELSFIMNYILRLKEDTEFVMNAKSIK
ncbi:hypothetical protein DCE79_16745 [Lysinibacillus sp. 2017]|uniref:hypothetical protein n=1 Tax=unclassified Lysinibacillus TaxID=2636778 RepID=UPI000D526A4C|nr:MULTISPECIES: hypothetical protein [unclassified Lysinibacillus]AWE08892.1 hypothetical protein DCE79_16745 [Lysinibacillus sp. 2017]TGN34724.1 hypothetical protein E4L99_13170 [Lysinibacillus sp. S2017]